MRRKSGAEIVRPPSSAGMEVQGYAPQPTARACKARNEGIRQETSMSDAMMPGSRGIDHFYGPTLRPHKVARANPSKPVSGGG